MDIKPQRKDIPGPDPKEVKITQAGGGCVNDEEPKPEPKKEDKP